MDTLNPYEPPQTLPEETQATARVRKRNFRITLAGLMVPCSLVAASITFGMTEHILATRFAELSAKVRFWSTFWGAMLVSVVTMCLVWYSFIKAMRSIRSQ